jgi:electron transport complex protein RnfG
MYKDIIKPALILFIICAVIAGALAYVNQVTKPIIEEREQQEKLNSLSEVLPGIAEFTELTPEELKASEYIVSDSINKLYKDDENGYVVDLTTSGYGGDINMLVGIDIENNITGVKIISHKETAGLGSKVAEQDFLRQFEGFIPADGFTVVKGNAQKEGEIDAVSGATVSSRAVNKGVEQAVKLVNSIEGGK